MKNEDQEFNFAAALKLVQEGSTLLENEGILTPLIKKLTKRPLKASWIPILARK